MRYTKIIALLLVFALSASIMAGCGDLDTLKRQYQEKHPFMKAFETLEPETVMVTVGTAAVTWQQLFHWIFFNTTQFEAQNGDITDWNQMLETGKTVAEHILSISLSNCLEYAYVEAASEAMGLEVNAAMQEAAKDQMLSDAAAYGDYDTFVDAIEAEYSTEEYYLYTKLMSAMYSAIYYELYGAEGEVLTEGEILEHAADDDYMMAKQIRIYLYDMNTAELFDEEKRAECLNHCEWIIDQLNACETVEEMEARFTELMLENAQDASAELFPDGYLFQAADLHPELAAAVQELEEYEYSDIIFADESYAILLRLPINVDVVPLSYAQYIDYGYNYTLRYLTSVEMYDETVIGWTTDFPAVFSPEYEALDLAELLADGKK